MYVYEYENLNGQRYNALVKSRFAAWRRKCFPRAGRVSLVKDHERCLSGTPLGSVTEGAALGQL